MKQTDFKNMLTKLSKASLSEFSNRLKINEEYIILGIPTPIQKKVAKDIAKSEGLQHIKDFIDYKDSLFYEEVVVTYFVFTNISKTLEKDLYFEYLIQLLKFNNSWATNDLFAAAIKPPKKIKEDFHKYILSNLNSKNYWDKRFSIICLMNYFIDDLNIDNTLKVLSSIKSNQYYVQMALGWAFATTLAKQREKTYPYMFSERIDKKVNQIAIQKAIESKRISEEDKIKLRELRSKLKLS